MIKTKIESWGKIIPVEAFSHSLTFSCDQFKFNKNTLPIGLLRSYGDSCLPVQDGHAIDTTCCNRILKLDSASETLEAEAGISFDEILQFIVPRGFFLPVTPGTKFVTLGGAIGNDVHGKNHHIDGNFSNFVLSFTLLRSDGKIYNCSPFENSDLFDATIGGLGLTGLILKATFKLRKIQSSLINVETIKFESLAEFMSLNSESSKYLYTVSWLDCLTKNSNGKAKVRGIYIRGNHANKNGDFKVHKTKSRLNIPFNFPNWALNNLTVKIFNFLYFHKQFKKVKSFTQHYDSFFYPLDAVLNWNRIYGRRGFYQYQCVLPLDRIHEFQKMLDLISESGLGSFLSVLKTFGPISSRGLLSFPRNGFTLCLDFANTGKDLEKLFAKLNEIVISSEGRIYPAKDFNMDREAFHHFYPNIEKFRKHIDPSFNSSFKERVGL